MKLGTRRAGVLAAVAASLLLGACVDDGDDPITRIDIPARGGSLFVRYVALGNSITAGFQSGGINATTQAQAYPVILANRAGARFGIPYLAQPGCPAPFTQPLTGRPAGPACSLRVEDPDSVPALVQNLAVPGARIADLLTPPTGQTALLNTLIVGNRTQVQAMIDAKPTFVSVWVGNNDALAAALSGTLGPSAGSADSTLTRLSSFQASLNQLVAAIQSAGPQGVMLIGVVDAVQAAPILQPGAYFWIARNTTTGQFNGKTVNANCSPVNNLGQPNPLAGNLVSFQIVGDANFPEINCDPAAYPVGDPRRGTYILEPAEAALVRARITQYNNAISAAATANNWIYRDPNLILAPFLTERTPAGTGGFNRIRKCQLLPSATTAAEFQTAVLLSCPVTGPTAAPSFFGSLISLDGIHPSAEAHTIIANDLVPRINTRYGTSLSTS